MSRLNWPSQGSQYLPLLLSFVCGIAIGTVLSFRGKKSDVTHSDLKRKLENDQTVSTNPTVASVTINTTDPVTDEEEELERLDIPENAPDHCPGIESDTAGKSDACAGCPNQTICASGEMKGADPSASEVRDKLASVKRKILVLSGKGGVGKSTVSSQLSWALQDRGYHVGLLDIDVCGPSVPMMTGCKGSDVHASADGWSPVYVGDSLAVMSIGFLLPDEDDAVIWRGPKKNGLIRQFLTDVTWGDLDVLIIDTPPGTTDEHLSIVTYLKEAGIDGAVIVTTPQEASLQDVRKEINFCKKVQIPVIGVVENMTNSVFDSQTGGAKEMCSKMEVPYAGHLQMDRDLFIACESGRSLASVNSESPALSQLNQVIDAMLESHLHLPLPTPHEHPNNGTTTNGIVEGVVQVP